MKQFKLKQDGFIDIKKQVLNKIIPLSIAAVMVGLGVFKFNPDYQNRQSNILPFVIPIAFGVVVFGILKGINRQKRLFDSYVLTISENEIVREQAYTPTIKIMVSDIQEINKNMNGSLTIKGRTRLDVIGVPAAIDNYEDLITALNKIKPLTTPTQTSISQNFLVPITLVTLALMATVYLATNKIIVGISGTIVSGFLIWSFIQIQRNKSIDNRTKRSSYFFFLVLLSIVAATVKKLFID